MKITGNSSNYSMIDAASDNQKNQNEVQFIQSLSYLGSSPANSFFRDKAGPLIIIYERTV